MLFVYVIGFPLYCLWALVTLRRTGQSSQSVLSVCLRVFSFVLCHAAAQSNHARLFAGLLCPSRVSLSRRVALWLFGSLGIDAALLTVPRAYFC